MKKYLWVLIAIVVVLSVYVWGAYNSLVNKNEAVVNLWAQVETQYQRRFDLIPNLVESVKGIFDQERAVFNALAEARAKYSGAASVSAKASAATEVESALSRLLVVVENYPQLKSAENVQTLMIQLEGTENRVSVERKRYNDGVRDLNIAVKRFPTNIIAGIFGFSEQTYFEAASGAENAPQVQF
ncbi:MAG TPA: LemA family protein [Candidatus Paceibacterota bacterium]|nr:LemA family protein [Candidatus Paceibacterota bacterium]